MQTNMQDPEWPKVNRMEGLTEGRMVHYVMPDGEHRPAIIVKNWNELSGTSNLIVFTDCSNDFLWPPENDHLLKDAGIEKEEVRHGHFWKTSVMYSEKPVPGTWHWIERA